MKLVGWLGFTDSLRQYFSLYRANLELAIDSLSLSPRGSFVHHDLELHYIRNKTTHVSPLYVGALTCNINVNYTTQNYTFRLR